MIETGVRNSAFGADKFGLKDLAEVHWNLTEPSLYEHSIAAKEATIVEGGALSAFTGHHTGRSPKDKHTVDDDLTHDVLWWEGNRKMTKEHFATMLGDFRAHVKGKKLFAQDLYGGADPTYRIKVRVFTEYAWHSLFIRQLLIRPELAELASFTPELTIIDLPSFKPDAKRHGGREGSDTQVAIDFTNKIVLICGSSYAGEMKKSVFTTLNFYLPARNVVPMHCSANVSHEGESALFFGLSGTGKTTLSSDPDRILIGDDEHGWGPDGVFNFEGGCYAKTIRLSHVYEPDIYSTTRRFGTILENVAIDPVSRSLDLDSEQLTENTRAAFPLDFISNSSDTGMAGQPSNVIFLTADAFGVLPPISRLTRDQALYHFISGYTAKLAGTEVGVKEPTATFSTCFGAPFMPRHPGVYAAMLGERLDANDVPVWLVNTGWTGGPYGVGRRIDIQQTRDMVRAALDGSLDGVPTVIDPVFGVQVPVHVPGVPADVLTPRATWADGDAYDIQARMLARMFAENFERFTLGVSPEVAGSGPRVD